MERVEFISTESGTDWIVSFALSQPEPGEVRSLILLRTPKYEFALDDSERGVSVSDEDHDDEENTDMLVEIEFEGDEVRIVSQNANYQLDCSRVDPDELEEAKRILLTMNFDRRYRTHIR